MKASTKRKIKQILSIFTRIGLKNKDFSIISNNCWGGWYYDRYHLSYLTPTIGLFFPAKDYLKFLSNIHHYLDDCELEKISFDDSKYQELLLDKEAKGWLLVPARELIITRLDDIEIVFIHYDSFEDAKSKWDRRKKRINWDNIIFKYNDQNGFELEDYEEFKKLNLPNKVFFTSNPKLKNEKSIYYIPKYEKSYGFALDDIHSSFPFKKYVNNLLKK